MSQEINDLKIKYDKQIQKLSDLGAHYKRVWDDNDFCNLITDSVRNLFENQAISESIIKSTALNLINLEVNSSNENALKEWLKETDALGNSPAITTATSVLTEDDMPKGPGLIPSMQVLSGFVASLGVAAIAFSFAVFSLGIVPTATAAVIGSIGITTTLLGIGIFKYSSDSFSESQCHRIASSWLASS